jgi:hypothetical protein
MRQWWSSIAPLRALPGIDLQSVDDFLADLKRSYGEGVLAHGAEDEDQEVRALIDRVFDAVFETKIKPVLSTQVELLPKPTRLLRAFTRYMAGQLAITSR